MFYFTFQKPYFIFKITKLEIPEITHYEITSVGTWYEEVKKTRYHIVISALLIEEKQIKKLAERVIKDVILKDPDLEIIELFFFTNGGIDCQLEAADAYVKWNSEEIFVKIRRGEIDFKDQSRWWED